MGRISGTVTVSGILWTNIEPQFQWQALHARPFSNISNKHSAWNWFLRKFVIHLHKFSLKALVTDCPSEQILLSSSHKNATMFEPTMGLKGVSTQPLSTNTEHILTIVYLVVDPDSQNQEYMLQRLKPLSHHIHWECRTQCSRHRSYASFQYHIHNTWFITTFGGVLPVFSGKSSGLHNQAVRGTAQISQAKFKVPPTGPSSLQPIRASAWLCFLESNLLGNSPCWLFFTWQ